MVHDNMSPNPELPIPGPREEGIDIDPIPPQGVTIIQTDQVAPRHRATLTPERLRAEIGRLDKVMALIVLVLAFFMGAFLAHNSDLWMHLAAGRLISQGQFPFGKDPFSYTTENETWANHAWLTDLIGYYLYKGLGEAETGGQGLVLVKALLVVALATVLLFCRRVGQSPWLSCVCVSLALVAMSSRLLLQPVCISFLFLGLTLWFLWRFERSAALGSPGASRWLWCLPVLFALWVNFDDWFLLGPLTLTLFVVGCLVQTAMSGRADGQSHAFYGTTLIAVLIAGLVACLLSPYHVHGLTIPTELWALLHAKNLQMEPMFGNYFQSGLGLEYIKTIPGWAFLILVALGLVSFALNLAEVAWWRLATWSVYFLFAILMARAVPFFAVVAAPITALNLYEIGVQRFGAEIPVEGKRKNWALGGRLLTIAGSLVCLFVAWPGWLHSGFDDARRTRRVALGVNREPSWQLAAEKIQELRQRGILSATARGFNFIPDLANYCAWFAPEEKGFFDYRLQLFPRISNAFLDIRRALAPPKQRDAASASKEVDLEPEEPGGQILLRKFGIDHVVVSGQEPGPSILIARHLWRDEEQWTPMYADGRTFIFGWHDPLNPNADNQFKSARPDWAKLAFASPAPATDSISEWEQSAPVDFWAKYFHGPAARPLGVETATFYLASASEMKRMWPLYFIFSRWITQWPEGMIAASGGGALTSPIVAGSMPQLYPGLLKFSVMMDLGPPADLVLAVRSARRAVRESPEDADAQFVLAKSYQELWSSQEARWAGANQAQLLQQIRQTQIVTALRTAVRLRPEDLGPRLALSESFQQMKFVDCELDQLNACMKILKEAGPARRETAEEFQQRVQSLDARIKAREQETKIFDRKNEYELASAGKPPLAKAQRAFQLGLAQQALNDLNEDPSLTGPNEIDLLLRILLATGQVSEVVRFDEATLNDWYKVQVAAALGHYADAEDYLGQMRLKIKDTSSRRLVDLTRFQTFSSGVQIGTLYEMTQAGAGILEGIDFLSLQGVLAVEKGDNAGAAKYFQEALDKNSPIYETVGLLTPFAASSTAEAINLLAGEMIMGNRAMLQASSRQVTLHYLQLLRREGN